MENYNNKMTEIIALLKQNGYTARNNEEIEDNILEYINETQDALAQKKAFIELFEKDPRAARVLLNWKDGAEPITELIAVIGAENVKKYIETHGDDAAYKIAQAEYLNNIKQAVEYERKFNENLENSLAELGKLETPANIIDKALEFINELVKEVKNGIYSIEKIKHIAETFADTTTTTNGLNIKPLVEYIKMQEANNNLTDNNKKYLNRLKLTVFDYIKDTMA